MRELDSHYSVKQRSLNVVSQKAQETIDKIYHVSKKSAIQSNWIDIEKVRKRKKKKGGHNNNQIELILKKKKKSWILASRLVMMMELVFKTDFQFFGFEKKGKEELHNKEKFVNSSNVKFS